MYDTPRFLSSGIVMLQIGLYTVPEGGYEGRYILGCKRNVSFLSILSHLCTKCTPRGEMHVQYIQYA